LAEKENFVKGRKIATIFRNGENFYSVLKISVDETDSDFPDKEVVVTGYLPPMQDDEIYSFYGRFQNHPKYGLQFVSSRFRKELPRTRESVIQYLSGDLFRGIGKKTAERIVDALGENAISRILENPAVLEEVPKLSGDKARELYEKLVEYQGFEQVLITLNQLGFGPQLAMRIYQTYKEQSLSMIQNTPYRLIGEVEGIGFNRADRLGEQLGIPCDDPDRLKAGCLFALETLCLREGHSYLEREDLLAEAKRLLETSRPEGIDEENLEKILPEMEEEGKLIIEESRIYLPSIFFSEKGIVKNILRLLEGAGNLGSMAEENLEKELQLVEKRLGITYARSQREAIFTALGSPIMILTGGPGTGKTTVLKGIVELYRKIHHCSLNPKDYRDREEPFPFVLAAPTGRAAKRLSESTGLPAFTIHRLLGWNGTDSFEHDRDHPIAGKLIIVDEMSMVDIWLAHQLFQAIPDGAQVILVGDEDQLPSVGPGQVLKDLLASRMIPTIRLKEIFRQEDGSSIIRLAHEIRNGRFPADFTVQQKDRSFIACTGRQIPSVVAQVAERAMKKGYSKREIQVLAPMYRGPAGIDRLNSVLQQLFNPNPEGKKRELETSGGLFRVGDKVLQLVNRPEFNVFNGDIGEIVAIFHERENEEREDQIVVSFDDVEVTYSRPEFSQITLAYCTSIHKSQGSEFPVVILPLVRSYYRMLRRNLIYTAVTRAKEKLILCGEEEAFRIACERADDKIRHSTLAGRLKNSEISGISQNEGEDYEEIFMRTDPMIGMEGITPYDFLDDR